MPTHHAIPVWQQISGLTPDAEKEMSGDERDDAVALLVAELEKIARVQFARASERPAGERTPFYDPLDRACREMEISRVKLSAYCVELTGLRASEITDRIKAATLPASLAAYLQTLFSEHLEPRLRQAVLAAPGSSRGDVAKWVALCLKWVRADRAGIRAQQFACKLGYANTSRLRKACTAAHEKSLEHLESDLLLPLVQKFLNALPAASDEVEPAPKAAPAPDRLEELKKELGLIGDLTPEDQAAIAALLKEGVA